MGTADVMDERAPVKPWQGKLTPLAFSESYFLLRALWFPGMWLPRPVFTPKSGFKSQEGILFLH